MSIIRSAVAAVVYSPECESLCLDERADCMVLIERLVNALGSIEVDIGSAYGALRNANAMLRGLVRELVEAKDCLNWPCCVDLVARARAAIGDAP